MDNSTQKQPIRICGVSGSALDRRHGFVTASKACEQIDVIIGDWMSEGNMVTAALRKLDKENSNQGGFGYEESFLHSIESSLTEISQKGIKVAVNAGASDPQALCDAVADLARVQGLKLKTAWVSGDNVLDDIKASFAKGEAVLSDHETGQRITALPKDIVSAQAYLGSLGVAEALRQGADIVICGRVADAGPVIGACMWWHDWGREDYDQLANALVAGHLIECSTYVTGGNFSGFKSVPGIEDLGFPVAEINHLGEVTITKLEHSGGIISQDTVTAQLVYEIQGPLYFNSDVVASLTNLSLEDVGNDRIRLHGVTGSPPPATTKVGLGTRRFYKAELHWSLVGLDADAKAELLERNIRSNLGEDTISKLTLLQFTKYGVSAENPESQDAATVDFRVFAQTENKEDLAPHLFLGPILDVIMCSYPGATPQPAITAGLPQPYSEYYVATMPQDKLNHRVHIGDQVTDIPPPSLTKTYSTQQESHDALSPESANDFGPSIIGPIGWIVHARSGDKGANANVGFWARDAEEYDWLRRLLSIEKLKALLGNEYKSGSRVERMELPGLQVVHFVLHNHLDRGVNSTATYDLLGKNVGEYLRARHVLLPLRFIKKGKI
ncbi:DUF1446 domain protein [Pyrenochaeta sp. DS3sAY3a]|nr:DUF1446 domain protein [Pyrenochaeta sp. DS3sAY3a]